MVPMLLVFRLSIYFLLLARRSGFRDVPRLNVQYVIRGSKRYTIVVSTCETYPVL